MCNLQRRSGRASQRKTTSIWRTPKLEMLESRLALSGSPMAHPAAQSAAAGATVNLSPAADTFVYGSSQFSNYGNANYLLVQNDSSSYATNDAEAYLRFNTASLGGAAVAKAVLTLTPLAVGRSAGSMTLGVEMLQAGDDTSWAEGSGGMNSAATGPATYYNTPSGTGTIATVSGRQLAVGRSISIDVTALVNQNINTNGIESFVIGTVSRYGSYQAVDFASREYATAAYRPVLTITMAGPVVPPPTVAVLPTAANVTNPFMGIKDPTLSSLTQSLDADGSISRADAIQILRTAETLGGVISQGVMGDLKTLLADAPALNMPSYVRVLAGDIINGNAANAHYQGQTLGNLAVGSSAGQLDKLIDKWFLGTDTPSTGGYGYSTVAVTGSIFATAPSHLDEDQGVVGDCYLISSLGTIADSVPAAIENMIVDNGVDAQTGLHTWTVRFYSGGTADYVTVDNMLPTSGGRLVFDGYGEGATNPQGLWIALIEKAFAQWNETGKEGRDGTNTYSGIEGGWMADVDAQVLGHSASSYSLSGSSGLQALIAGMTNHQAVTIGTTSSSNANDTLSYGLFGSHAYAVVGYNASNQTFTLYNPWGIDQPTQALSWSQLQSTGDGFAVANASGTQAFATSVIVPRPAIAPRPAAALAAAAASYSSGGRSDSSDTRAAAFDSVFARFYSTRSA